MKKLVFATLLVATIFCSSSVTFAANIEDIEVDNHIEYSDDSIEPRADVIVTKFRYYEGKYQYRRWNQTRGYWVDPEWIDA